MHGTPRQPQHAALKCHTAIALKTRVRSSALTLTWQHQTPIFFLIYITFSFVKPTMGGAVLSRNMACCRSLAFASFFNVSFSFFMMSIHFVMIFIIMRS
jgi:hypothetical protein